MFDFGIEKARRALAVLVAFIPWVISMYVLYWLDYGGIWSSETPHRGKISVSVLVVGMSLSFLLYSAIARRKRP